MEARFDVAVIGAGPAGSIAARECAKQGLETLLIEKEKFPRSKPCGGGVSVKAIDLIDEKIPEDLIERRVRGFRFFSPSLDCVEFSSEDLFGISTTRDRFDAFLVRLAMAEGCKFVDSDAVTDISILKDKASCKMCSGRSVEGDILIGADGSYGITAGKAGIRERWNKDEVGLCLEGTWLLDEERVTRTSSGLFELYFLNSTFWGWLFPKRSSFSMGIGGCMAGSDQSQEVLRNFCNTISKLKGIDAKISNVRGHLVPGGGFRRKIVSDRVMLVGDAAGFVDPLTGEGIYYAIRSGLSAATACKKAIEDGDASTSFLETHYSKVCEKAFEKDLEIALDLAYKIHNHINIFFDLLKSYSGSGLLELARGETSYGAIRRKVLPWLVVKLAQQRIQKLFDKPA